MPFVEPAASARTCSRPRRNEARALRRDVGFEVVDVAPTACDGFRLRVGEIAEQVQVVDVGNARGKSSSMNFSAPLIVSMPTLTKMPGGSLMLSRAAWISRGTWRSFDRTRRARSGAGAYVKSAWAARLDARMSA